MKKFSFPFPFREKNSLRERGVEFFRKYGHIVCAVAVPMFLFWLIYLCMEIWPFGSGSVLVLDLNGQYVYFFEALHNFVRGDASLIYSWSRSLGGEFIGIYAYYLASPLSYLVALFPSDHITEALLLIILLKAGIAGGTLDFYLQKHRPNSNKIGNVVMSTLYALCSYMVAYGHNTMWMDALMLLPLTLYGVEELIKKGKFKLYVFSLTLTLCSTFYIGWMTCLFLLPYFFYAYFCVCNVRYGDNNYYGEKLHFLKSLLRMGLFSAISILISCLILVPTYYSMTFGKTDFSTPSWEMVSQFDLLEFFSKMLPGSYDTVRPEGLPFVYCGVIALILLPLYFISKNVSAKEKIGGGLMLALLVFCMNNSVIDLIFHCFQRPNWLNYRYSFLFVFLVVVFSARALEEIQTIRFAYIAGVGAGLLMLILLVQLQHYEYIDDFTCIWVSILCIGAHLATLGTVKLKKLTTQVSYLLLACICGLETFATGVMTLDAEDDDVVFSSRTGYVNFMNRITPMVDYIQETDTSFYRMEKTIFRNVCDNMALNIRGISNSTSTLNASAIAFLNQIGYSSSSHWSKYLGGTPVNDSLLGLKYLITTTGSSTSSLYTPYSIDETNDLISYLNPYALSIAYAADTAIKELDISDPITYASPFVLLNEIVTALLGEEETVELFKPIEYELTLNNVDLTYRSNVYETVTNENGEEETISIPYYFYAPSSSSGTMIYTLNLPEDFQDGSDVFFFFCSNYPRTVEWTFEGGSSDLTGTFFDNESDCIQSLGQLSKDGFYDLEVSITNDSSVFYIMQEPEIFYYLDQTVFIEAMTRLAEGNFLIDNSYTESHLTGTITVAEGENVVFTTIPYDKGWNIYVDGEKVESYETLDALLAFDITPGEHSLEFVYRSSYMVGGWILSAVGIFLLILMLLLDHFWIQPRQKGKREAFEKKIAEQNAKKEAYYQSLLAKADENRETTSVSPPPMPPDTTSTSTS
jgi:uncharacterized membrane protein YfhO